MRKFLLILSLVSLSACVNIAKDEPVNHEFNRLKIEPVFSKNISIRALSVNPDHIFFAGNQGKFGYLNTADHSLAYIGSIAHEGKNPEFRSIASTKESDFIMSVGNPALLYKVNYFGKRMLMYQEQHKQVFYDAMAFWDELNGMAIGDPTDGCMSVLLTRDGGETWEKQPCENLPKAMDGEAAFAASNTNIAIVGDKAWFVSGGATARVYFSDDKGKTWTVYDTPMVDGKASSGIYSVDFYDESTGVIYGGDYTQPEMNTANKALTTDGGKTWQLLADTAFPGYKSCVRFVPNSGGQELVAVGFTGIAYSNDQGKTWRQLSDASFYTLRFINEFTAYAAGENGIAKITFFENGLKE